MSLLTMIKEFADAQNQEVDKYDVYPDWKTIQENGQEIRQHRCIAWGDAYGIAGNLDIATRKYKDGNVPHGEWRHRGLRGKHHHLVNIVTYDNGVPVKLRDWHSYQKDHPRIPAYQVADAHFIKDVNEKTESLETTVTNEHHIPLRHDKHFGNGDRLLATRTYTEDEKPYGTWYNFCQFRDVVTDEIHHLEGRPHLHVRHSQYHEWYDLTHYKNGKAVLTEHYTKGAEHPSSRHFLEADVKVEYKDAQPNKIIVYNDDLTTFEEVVQSCGLDPNFTGYFKLDHRSFEVVHPHYDPQYGVPYVNGIQNGIEERNDGKGNKLWSVPVINGLYEGEGTAFDPKTRIATYSLYEKGVKHGKERLHDRKAWKGLGEHYYWHGAQVPKAAFKFMDGTASICTGKAFKGLLQGNPSQKKVFPQPQG